MGLLDKLFGASGSEVLNKLKDAAETVAKEAGNAVNAAVNAAEASASGTSGGSQDYRSESSASEPSGFSWGPDMPDEENQYNYPGDYRQYFYNVFQGAFPIYRLTSEEVRGGKATVITFWQGDRKALVVELMSETSSAQKIRYACKTEGVPYLRFYYNHEGWWNTKAYVIQRAQKALGRN